MEKTPTQIEELEHVKTSDLVHDGGILLDVQGRQISLKTASDGHTILVPQPSTDPNDPLNWSGFKKHIILFTIAWGAFTADFTSAAGIPCIFLQAAEWHMDPNIVNYSNNLNVLMMGIGGLLWVPVISFWGRAPVLFWTSLCGTLFCVGAGVAKDYNTHYAMRAVMGLFLTAPQVISIAFIKDIFFFHEHARKIGLWAAIYISSPYIGPQFANFMVGTIADWRAVYWMCIGVCTSQVVLIICFLDECFYLRHIPQESQPDRGSRIMRVLGIWQFKNHDGYFYTVSRATNRLLATLTKPALLLVLFGYFLCFMWAIGINVSTAILIATPTQFGGYGFNSVSVGYLYFTPIVAILLGEVFGHFFNDFLAHSYIRRHKGVFEPEVRLYMCYVSGIFMIPGLILLGFALLQHLHYGVIVVGWGLFAFGIMTTSVAVTTYAIEVYPMAPGEVSGFIQFMRVIGGFSVAYFQQPWGLKMGFNVSFGIQAATVGLAMFAFGLSHYYGKVLRRKGVDIN